MAKKRIRFDYFKPCSQENPEQEIDLTSFMELLNDILAKHGPNPTIPYSGGEIILSKAEYHSNYIVECASNSSPFPFPLWKLVFTRKKFDAPGIWSDTLKELNALELEPDEYIAEDTTLLYDPALAIVVLQRNITGTPPSKICDFFNSMNTKDDDAPEVDFVPLVDARNIEKAKNCTFVKNVNLRFTNLRNEYTQDAIKNNNELKGLIPMVNGLSKSEEYSISTEIILKIKERSKGVSFKNSVVNGIIDTLGRLLETEQVDKLTIKGLPDEESTIEEIDLIHNAIRVWLDFDIDNTKFIPSTRIFDYIAHEYSQGRNNFQS